MSRTRQMVVGLVGHCGADASYLRIAVTGSAPGSRVVVFHDEADFYTSLGAAELDLVLLNRRVDYGFEVSDGVELVRQIKARRPQQRVMMEGDLWINTWDGHYWGAGSAPVNAAHYKLDPLVDLPVEGEISKWAEVVEGTPRQVEGARRFCAERMAAGDYRAGCPAVGMPEGR